MEISLGLPHINHAPDAVALLHVMERFVDAGQWLPVGDEFVDFEFSGQVVVHKVRQLSAAFDASESTAFPYAASN